MAVAGYNIYLKAEGESVFTKLNTSLINDLTYAFSELSESTNYQVTLSAVDDLGNESEQTNPVDFTTNGTPSLVFDISPETFWHKGDLATTDANALGDAITTSTDSLSTTSYNLTGSAKIAEQNTLQCFDFLSTVNILRANIPAAAYHSSFSIFKQIKMSDGIPAASEVLWHTQNSDASSRLLILISNTGALNITYNCGGASISAVSSSALFAEGDMADFADLDIVFNNGGVIEVYLNGSAVTMTGNDISAVDMTQFSGIGNTNIGAREISGSVSLPFTGYMRNIIFQPVAHTSQNRTALGNL